jgi:hypothetical protein
MDGNREISTNEIKRKLREIRVLRFICHFPLLCLTALIVFASLSPDSWETFLVPVIKAVAFVAVPVFVLGIGIGYMDCPRCGNKYHVNRSSHGFLSRYRFNYFTRKCLNCELNLKGTNI